VNGHGLLAAFFGALSLGVASFGGLVLPKLASGDTSGGGKLEARVVVLKEERGSDHDGSRCPRHELPGDWPTV